MIRILEIAWLVIALITAIIAVYQFFAEGWQSCLWMFGVTMVALIMYMVRHKQRIRMEEHEKDAAKYH
ncbi:MAG: hypothetical protein DWQ44_01185 [Bacteroidetes bacterium]|nr:MAG: hypothetical protein DWQ33_00650 [Bacteroidota bacterium]REK04969.1 MAG: hypothetical protein DWQ39_07070 [Bacteroidota bacterium]REK36527.1 MAG: hypothetical protein DWQ44_01185 [Bacteroidota bacterium]REK50893.1 MAG: hypothetical protein DWQ48_02045 [Bacteroidota bacterium]